jgi:hypothetical protein
MAQFLYAFNPFLGERIHIQVQLPGLTRLKFWLMLGCSPSLRRRCTNSLSVSPAWRLNTAVTVNRDVKVASSSTRNSRAFSPAARVSEAARASMCAVCIHEIDGPQVVVDTSIDAQHHRRVAKRSPADNVVAQGAH